MKSSIAFFALALASVTLLAAICSRLSWILFSISCHLISYSVFFASHGIPPRAPTIGQFWYNADTGILGIWNGTTWFPVYTPVAAPVWITPESISYTSGETFTFQASNATTYNVVSGSIPGATFTNGVLSGTPTAGNYTITVRATGAGGFIDKKFNVLILSCIICFRAFFKKRYTPSSYNRADAYRLGFTGFEPHRLLTHSLMVFRLLRRSFEPFHHV